MGPARIAHRGKDGSVMLDGCDRSVFAVAPRGMTRPARGGIVPCPDSAHSRPRMPQPGVTIWREATAQMPVRGRNDRDRPMKRVADTRFFHVRGRAPGKEAA
jgi:hypothetical protein